MKFYTENFFQWILDTTLNGLFQLVAYKSRWITFCIYIFKYLLTKENVTGNVS
jgi:hypothetical protein